jgi:glycosyltransferase involved in cell wall biosynthesis
MRALRAPLRSWDVRTARGVDMWLANSAHVRGRIQRLYGRDATVLHPWVDVDRFVPGSDGLNERYLVVSALGPYKRIELAIAAAAELGRGLDIIGRGPDERRLRAAAGAGDIRFHGWLDDSALARAYRTCRALLMPGEEDFGIAPLEAMASGRPVIAFAHGGALETVVDGVTGCLFAPQTSPALAAAMMRGEGIRWDPTRLRSRAEEFSRMRFLAEMRSILHSLTAAGN